MEEKWYFKYWSVEWTDNGDSKAWKATEKVFTIIQFHRGAALGQGGGSKKKKKTDSQGILKEVSIGHCEYLALRVGGSEKLRDIKCY